MSNYHRNDLPLYYPGSLKPLQLLYPKQSSPFPSEEKYLYPPGKPVDEFPCRNSHVNEINELNKAYNIIAKGRDYILSVENSYPKLGIHTYLDPNEDVENMGSNIQRNQ